MVWGAWVERFVAHYRRTGYVRQGARDGRLQSLRLRLSPQARREVGVAGLLRGIHRSWHGRRFETAEPLYVDAYPAPSTQSQTAAGDLQLLGGNRVECVRKRTGGAGGEGSGSGCRPFRDG